LPLAGEQLVGEHDKEPGHEVKGEGMIVAGATNLGDASVDGANAPVTISDQLPPGLDPIKVEGQTGRGVPGGNGLPVKLSCSAPHKNPVTCTFEGKLPPFEQLEIQISVKVTAEKPVTEENKVTVTGGETQPGTIERPVKIVGAGGSTPFGVEAYEFTPENEDGSLDTQAGSHPFQLSTTFYLNQTYGFYKEFNKILPQAPAMQKDLTFKIPPGVLGNPTAMPQCSGVDFGALDANSLNSCPGNTAIGVASVTFNDPILISLQTWSVPVFNLVPAPGEPAKFGFEVVHVPVVLDTSVRTGGDYGVTVSVKKTPEAVQVLGATVTLWGVPGDPKHDHARGWNCLGSGHYVEGLRGAEECKLNEFSNPSPFLVLPTSCAKPLTTEAAGTSWPDAEKKTQSLRASNQPPWAESSQPVKVTGCEKLPFDPSISVRPDEAAGSTPTGLNVEVNLPQTETTLALPPALAEGDIKETKLELPEGLAASAGAANGLGTCGLGQSGLLGEPFEEHFEQQFTPDVASCPDAANVGTVEVNTPFLPNPLHGSVYLGIQNTNPFAPPLVGYLIATEENPVTREGSKVLIKLAGEVKIDPNTGHLISVFKNTPQAPFEHLRVHLFGGERASQATPARCDSYHAVATFTAWNEIAEGKLATKTVGEKPGEGFQITSGPGGSPCPAGALPFGPTFGAGPTNTQAGAFTPFNLTIGRPDGNQALTGLSMRLPQGAAAMLSSVTPCPIAVADTGQCPPASFIGHTTTSSGLGGSPVTLGGEAFLTGGFDGAPFGVSVKTPAEPCTPEKPTSCAGPFNIGVVVANSTIQVDQNTAAATITAVETRILESSGGINVLGGLPTIIKGVPVQLKAVHVSVDAPNFEFNPTNCSGRSVTGAPIATSDTLTGAEGGSASQLTPYSVTGCQNLSFTPKFTASVAGQASKANGTTFTVKVESARGQANIAKTFLALPIALPSRLSTIQKACLAATFEANPASCPEGSNIGFAVAHTPVLKKPLVGPAYLVSHGNASFPDVQFVLQGEGITIVLDGKTDIKKGITYSRFETVPDAPVETFETVLPAGPHSALTANVPESENFNLCKHAQELVMPTEITGQNGAVIKQQTKIALTGCKEVIGFCAGTRKATARCKLQLALEACRKKYKGKAKAKKRAVCEAQARKKYAHKKPAKKHKKK
jgi:hypothetical protein